MSEQKSASGYYVGFGVLSIAVGTTLFVLIHRHTNWPFYATWMATLSGTTFLIYGLDKLFSRLSSARVPELYLHSLAMLGGFPGGWLGMALFSHKTNQSEHHSVWLWLSSATLLHGALAVYLLAHQT